MKKTFIFLIAFVFSAAISSNICAQQVAPPGAGDKDLADKNIKTRSIELERIDREARKNGSSATTVEDRLAVKYAEIKADFEQIQLSQDAVIKAYQSAGKIDYAAIGKSALEINKSAVRLNSNLFPAPPIEDGKAEKEEKDEKKEAKPAKSVRDLIVDLDNTIGSFAASKMFQNLRVVEPSVAEKTKLDLEKIIELSASLDAEARKKAETGN